jgi:probable rRNA maturation factor
MKHGSPPQARLCLWLRNEAGRRSVPLRASFERWIGAIPDIARRRGRTEINILVVGEAAGRDFNRRFRGHDYATNVLSFPYEALPDERTSLLGDLVICAPVVAREAAEQGKAARDHYAHLAIHGVLHLLGHDHEREAEAAAMEGIERQALASLGIADPYRDEDMDGRSRNGHASA